MDKRPTENHMSEAETVLHNQALPSSSLFTQGSELDTVTIGQTSGVGGQLEGWGAQFYSGREIEGVYRIEGELARGGMGIVFLASDKATGKTVVIKTLRPDVAHENEFKKRFIVEAEEWIKIGVHPNIVRAHTVYEIDSTPLIVAEFIQGQSLYALLHEGQLAMDSALQIAVQICWGMAYAHDRGIIHRDLKPANILISELQVAMVTDFGLVKRLLSAPEDQDATLGSLQNSTAMKTIGALGTPEYMAPEQWQGQCSVSSDIYSFGVLLYEMLCGRRPFDVSNLRSPDRVKAYQSAHASETAPSPSSLHPDLPKPVCTLIESCLEKDPTSRPSSFRDIAKQLLKVAASLGYATVDDEPAVEDGSRAEKEDQAWALSRLALNCVFRGDYLKADRLNDEANVYFLTSKDSLGLGQSSSLRGLSAYFQSDYDSALQHYEAALTLWMDGGHHAKARDCLSNIALYHQICGQSDKALELYDQALNLPCQEHHPIQRARIYNNICAVQFNLKRYKEARKAADFAMEISLSENNRKLHAEALLNIAFFHFHHKDWKDCEACILEAWQIMKSIHYKYGESQSLVNLSALYLDMPGCLEKARTHYEKALKLKQDIGDQNGVGLCLDGLGVYYMRSGELEKAKPVLQECLELKTKFGLAGQDMVRARLDEIDNTLT